MAGSSNNNYVISIRRDEKDDTFDKESQETQKAINTLVNERMNQIYLLMNKNRNTYNAGKGELDDKLNELDVFNFTDYISGKKKFDFVDKNRPNNNSNRERNPDIEYTPYESKLINHVCPVSNYYTIRAYLSDSIADQVKQLPNVISCQKSVKLQPLGGGLTTGLTTGLNRGVVAGGLKKI